MLQTNSRKCSGYGKMDAMNGKHLKPPAETKVVVAMSGGVDSSVAAALLVEQGYQCIGVMMRLWAELGAGEGSANKCCSLESVHDARRVADELGMPFYLINVEQPFKQRVVDFFIDGYSQGVTPNPCLECNRHIRFDYLLNYARRMDADYLATGHYARLRRGGDGKVHLCKGVDEGKDQSYVLSVLGQAELNDVLFPVGDYPKAEVRRIAAAAGCPSLPSTTRWIYVLFSTMITVASSRSGPLMPCARGRSATATAAFMANTQGCPATLSANAKVWASVAQPSLFLCWNWTTPTTPSSSALQQNSVKPKW